MRVFYTLLYGILPFTTGNSGVFGFCRVFLICQLLGRVSYIKKKHPVRNAFFGCGGWTWTARSCIFSAEKMLRSARRLWQSAGLSFTTASPFELFARGLIPLGRVSYIKKKHPVRNAFFGCGGWTWTNDLRVMSPTSYQLLHPAIFNLTQQIYYTPKRRIMQHFFQKNLRFLRRAETRTRRNAF